MLFCYYYYYFFIIRVVFLSHCIIARAAIDIAGRKEHGGPLTRPGFYYLEIFFFLNSNIDLHPNRTKIIGAVHLFLETRINAGRKWGFACLSSPNRYSFTNSEYDAFISSIARAMRETFLVADAGSPSIFPPRSPGL